MLKHRNHSPREAGYTLIEIIIVIVIVGIIGVTLMKALEMSLMGAPKLEKTSQALELAQKRMDLILGQARLVGFANYNDPCVASPNLPICTVPAGFTVTSALSNSWQSNTNLHHVTVTVTGDAQAQLQSLVANY